MRIISCTNLYASDPDYPAENQYAQKSHLNALFKATPLLVINLLLMIYFVVQF